MNSKILSMCSSKVITLKSKIKADSFSVDNKYKTYFDQKFEKEYDCEVFDNSDEEEELDYFSENEICHRTDFTVNETILIAKKIEQRFKQMNRCLNSTLKPLIKENLKAVRDVVSNLDNNKFE